MEALNRVAIESKQSPLEIMSIIRSTSEVALFRDDLEKRILNYTKWGISSVKAWAKVARDIGISTEVVERIVTQYPAGKASFLDKFNGYKNKLRFLAANILILIGILLTCDPQTITINRNVVYVEHILDFSIGIILLINGSILLIKTLKVYFTNK